jgi:hypothetical protein
MCKIRIKIIFPSCQEGPQKGNPCWHVHVYIWLEKSVKILSRNTVPEKFKSTWKLSW